MVRTILLFLLPAFLVATHWSRLEQTGTGDGRLLWIAVLALLPALFRPTWARVAAYVVAAVLAVRLAFELSPVRALPFRDGEYFGPLSSRLWRGFEAFFQVELPINAIERPQMHGVILLAVFGFCAVLAVAIASRRPLLASAALIAGAGWPATILTGRAELERGAIILAAALLLFAGMRSMPTLDVRQPLLAGAAIVIAAVAVSTSPSVAKGEFVDGWRTWDVSLGAAPSVGVEYVWDSNYAGIRFPQKPTTVLSVDADQQAGVYWRATTLDLFSRGRWLEDLHEGAEPQIEGDLENLSDDPFLPSAARNPDNWLESRVEVEGLRDTHLVAAAAPVAYEPGDRAVSYFFSNVAVAAEGIGRGDSYTVYSYAPQPTPKQLAASPGVYPPFVSDLYLTVEESVLPPFGTPEREELVEGAFERNPRLDAYADMYRQAQDVVGNARNPYSAVVALETWFRTGGDFVYDERPPLRRDAPALASFVVSTRRGYCQHFAGAMALMLRQLGIPARVAAGFTSGRYDNDDGRWIVTDRNAHTWVEVWFEGYGWLSFDPTPGRGQLGGTYTASSLRFDVDGAIAAAGNAGDAATSDLLRGETGGPDRPRGADPGGARATGGRSAGRSTGTGIVTLLLLGALVAAVLLAAAKLVRRAARFVTRDPRGLAGACRRDLAAFMTDQGVAVPASATPREVGAIAQREFGVDPTPLMAEVTLARFGPPETAGPAAARARRELRRIRKALRARLSIPRRTRGLLSIRSLGV
jgi:transglutaminase-like putative cysteine protease